jgi:hypothetical protein
MKKFLRREWMLALGLTLILAGLAAAVLTGCSTQPSHPSAAASTPAAVATATAAPPAPPSSPAPPPAPVFTAAQQQVLDSAQGYLTDGQGFSKAGLMKQLTSSFGEGFSRKLAKFALANLAVNWNHQAVLSARGYVQSGQGFSYTGLVQQLESPYGEQFTPGQAQHGASVALGQG